MNGDLSSLWLAIDWSTWIRLSLDLGLAGLVALLAWRLQNDGDAAPSPAQEKAWEERERRLREIHDSLRRLVAQAQEDARALDARLAAQVAHAETTLRSAEAVTEAIRAPRAVRKGEAGSVARPGEEHAGSGRDRRTAGTSDVASRVRALAEDSLTAEEIAREVDLPIADVRFLLALGARGASPVMEGAA